VIFINLLVHPLTPSRWNDLEELFGQKGACGGCWGVWWRVKKSIFEANKGGANKAMLRSIVESGEIPGLLGYVDNKPIAWCSVAPRKFFPRLENSRILAPIDDERVWSLVCFFIAKGFRRKGYSVQMLKEVISFVKNQGGRIVEGYPFSPDKSSMPDAFAWMGLSAAFLKAGFFEVERRSKTRPIMRYYLYKTEGIS
jgi:hypothetical protein